MSYNIALTNIVTELLHLFEEYRVVGWITKSKFFLKKLEHEESIDENFVMEFVGFGMGNLLDLYICHQNGHAVSNSSESDANQRLNNLVERLLKFTNNKNK